MPRRHRDINKGARGGPAQPWESQVAGVTIAPEARTSPWGPEMTVWEGAKEEGVTCPPQGRGTSFWGCPSADLLHTPPPSPLPEALPCAVQRAAISHWGHLRLNWNEIPNSVTLATFPGLQSHVGLVAATLDNGREHFPRHRKEPWAGVCAEGAPLF